MKLKSGYLLRTIAGTHIVIPVADRVIEFKGMITLNDTAAFLWRALIQGDKTEEELVSCMLSEYEVEPEIARKDVTQFIQGLRTKNMLEE